MCYDDNMISRWFMEDIVGTPELPNCINYTIMDDDAILEDGDVFFSGMLFSQCFPSFERKLVLFIKVDAAFSLVFAS